MKLCYGSSSPFSRKARVFAIECGLAERITLVRVGTMGLHDPELAAANPLVKVPTLMTDEGEALFDSPVICQYLDTLHGGRPLIPAAGWERWRVLRREALGDGLMEALIFLGFPQRRPDGNETALFAMERQREKVEACIDLLERHVEEMEREGVTVGSISVACGLGWRDFHFPGWEWRDGRPRLARWFEEFSQRTSMRETAPTKSSK
jgi:glutathione S-transferase